MKLLLTKPSTNQASMPIVGIKVMICRNLVAVNKTANNMVGGLAWAAAHVSLGGCYVCECDKCDGTRRCLCALCDGDVAMLFAVEGK